MGKIHIRSAAGSAGLNGNTGDFGVNRLNSNPDAALVDLAFDGFYHVGLVVQNAFTV